MEWMRNKLRKWLGIQQNETNIANLDHRLCGLTTMGVDVHFKSPHMILIFSKINGGQIRHVDADFKDLRELNDFTKQLKEKYRPKDIFYDVPHGYRQFPWT